MAAGGENSIQRHLDLAFSPPTTISEKTKRRRMEFSPPTSVNEKTKRHRMEFSPPTIKNVKAERHGCWRRELHPAASGFGVFSADQLNSRFHTFTP